MILICFSPLCINKVLILIYLLHHTLRREFATKILHLYDCIFFPLNFELFDGINFPPSVYRYEVNNIMKLQIKNALLMLGKIMLYNNVVIYFSKLFSKVLKKCLKKCDKFNFN